MSKRKPCKDHLGNEFPSVTAMCRDWGINDKTYHLRIKKGMSVEKALTTPPERTQPQSCTDHLGNKFPTVTAMCKHYNIKKGTYLRRIEKGDSIKNALTKFPQHGKRKCVDHLGQEFSSIREMCRRWNVSHQMYSRHIKKGWSVKKALTTWSTDTYISDNCKILKQIDDDYYECLLNNKNVIMTHRQILEYREEV